MGTVVPLVRVTVLMSEVLDDDEVDCKNLEGSARATKGVKARMRAVFISNDFYL